MLVGKPGAGKDTAAAFISKHGYDIVRIAEPVYRVCDELLIRYPTNHAQPHANCAQPHVNTVENQRSIQKNRWLLRRVGEFMKTKLGESVWVESACRRIHSPFVIPDVRFRVEINALRDKYDDTIRSIRICRDGCSDTNYTESCLEDFVADFTIYNNGSMESLHEQLSYILRKN